MRFFVVGPDGSNYGPADFAMLNQWIREGRIIPTTILEQEGTRQRVMAQSVAGLAFNQGFPQPPQQGYAPTGYPQPGNYQQGYPMAPGVYNTPYGFPSPLDDGSLEMKRCWKHLAYSVFCIPILFNITGIYLASRALRRGNSAAILGIVVHVMVAWVIYRAISGALQGLGL